MEACSDEEREFLEQTVQMAWPTCPNSSSTCNSSKTLRKATDHLRSCFYAMFTNLVPARQVGMQADRQTDKDAERVKIT